MQEKVEQLAQVAGRHYSTMQSMNSLYSHSAGMHRDYSAIGGYAPIPPGFWPIDWLNR